MPIDYVPNGTRKVEHNVGENCMRQSYRKRAVGTAPELYRVDPTPSLAIIKDGVRKVEYIADFRGKGRKVSNDVESKADRIARIQALAGFIGDNWLAHKGSLDRLPLLLPGLQTQARHRFPQRKEAMPENPYEVCLAKIGKLLQQCAQGLIGEHDVEWYTAVAIVELGTDRYKAGLEDAKSNLRELPPIITFDEARL
jgi:hypothetical protein